MDGILFLIPLGLVMGLVGLGAFLWSLRAGQYDDLKGAAERILLDDDESQAAGPIGEPITTCEKEGKREVR